MSLQQTDQEAAAVAVAPRVTLADIEDAIADRFDLNGLDVVTSGPGLDVRRDGSSSHDPLKVLSICILVMKNGYTVIGKSAPASIANYDRAGKKFAYEDAMRQLWPLMGFSLRDRLAAGFDYGKARV